MTDHDHSKDTHMAKCDEPECDYVATTHAHDEDAGATDLANDLASHNKVVHGKETNSEEIVEAVKAKMQTLS